MASAAARPSARHFISLLQQCAQRKALAEGKWVHACILRHGLNPNVFLNNHIIIMYIRCGSMVDAFHVFNRMPAHNMVSWNAMIGGYARFGPNQVAFTLFQQMQHVGFNPDTVTFMEVLRAINKLEFISLGKLAHAHIVGMGLESDIILCNCLVNMYGKFGNSEIARQIFDLMPTRNAVSWNVMIGSYSIRGNGEEVLKLYYHMQQEGIQPDRITFLSILNACNSPQDVVLGKLVHAHAIMGGLKLDVMICNALVNMYGKCGNIAEARSVFDMMKQRDIISWSTLIGGYAENGHAAEAFETFQLMHKEGFKPDRVTFINLLNICPNVALGKLVHACIVVFQLEKDIALCNALVSMYGKCGSIENARSIFDRMPECDTISWNAMIASYAEHGCCEEAFNLFEKMQREGMKVDKISFINILNACNHPNSLHLARLVHANIVNRGFESDVIVGTAVVNMFGRCGSIEDAWRVFHKMPYRNVVSWTVMIGVYVQYGFYEKAFRLFQQMQQEGLKPNKVTLINFLNICESPEALVLGKLIHAHAEDQGIDLDVGIALIGMYGKCGSINDAHMMFSKISKDDTSSWSAMIAAYAHHGQGKEALEIFWEMQKSGTKPDEITMISVINACSYAGFVDEGLCCFNSLCKAGIIPSVEHYNCMVDLFGRAGCLDEAEDIINQMPFQPDAVTWTSFLGSCKKHGCIDRGKLPAECLVTLDPESTSAYVVIANLYAAAGRWEDVVNVKKLIADIELKSGSAVATLQLLIFQLQLQRHIIIPQTQGILFR